MKTPKHTRTCSGGSAPLPWRLGERGEGVSGKEGWVSRGSPAASFQGGAQPRQSPQRGLRTALGVLGGADVFFPPRRCLCTTLLLWLLGQDRFNPASLPFCASSRAEEASTGVENARALVEVPCLPMLRARSASSGMMLTSLCCRVGEKTKHIFFYLLTFFFKRFLCVRHPVKQTASVISLNP